MGTIDSIHRTKRKDERHMTNQEDMLLEEAHKAREFSYSPYSKCAAGAAVLASSGKIYGGCNIENTTYSLTNCAERTAIYRAISSGEEDLLAIAVVADGEEPAVPCGACRQVMKEFNISRVIMGNLAGDKKTMTLDELLPEA